MKTVVKTKEEEFKKLHRHGLIGMGIFFIALNLLAISGVLKHFLIYEILPANLALIFTVGWLVAHTGPFNILRFMSFILIGIAISICGFVFNRLRITHRLKLNLAEHSVILITTLFSFSLAWVLFLSELLTFSGLVWIKFEYTHYVPCISWLYGPLFPLFFNLNMLGYFFIGMILLLWVVTIFSLRNILGEKILLFAAIGCFFMTAILLLIGIVGYWVNGFAPWLAPYGYTRAYWGFLLLVIFAGPACFFNAIIFSRKLSSPTLTQYSAKGEIE